MPRRITINVNDENFHSMFVRVMNGISNLTPRQLEVISEFVSYGIISTRIRKVVRKKLNFPSVAAFNVVISDLKKKGAIIHKNGNLEINPYLLPENNQKSITIDFIWDEEN